MSQNPLRLKEEPAVAIVIVNHNGWQYTTECLESLGRLTYRNWYVVLVDNGSTDDSVDHIRAWARGEANITSPHFSGSGWPKPVYLVEYDGEPHLEVVPARPRQRELILIRLPDNRGFAGGNNAAIRYVLRRGTDWTWLLNNDTVVGSNALSAMITVGLEQPRTAAVGCRILYYDRPDMIEAAGGGRFYFWAGISRNYGWRQPNDGRWTKPFEPHYVSGASVLVRCAAWRDVGYLDESFFFYAEEVDWQLRARTRGWRITYAPDAYIYHRGRATAARKPDWLEFMATCSNLKVCRRHAPWTVPTAVLINCLRAFRRLLSRQPRRALAVLNGIFAALAAPPTQRRLLPAREAVGVKARPITTHHKPQR